MSKKYKFKKHQGTTENSIFPHKHCPTCNKMMPPGMEYCSEECENRVTQKKKKDKKKLWKTIGIIVGVIAVIIVVFSFVSFILQLNS